MPTHVRFIDPRRRVRTPRLFLFCLLIFFGLCALLVSLTPADMTEPLVFLGP